MLNMGSSPADSETCPCDYILRDHLCSKTESLGDAKSGYAIRDHLFKDHLFLAHDVVTYLQ
jgi:hypothetical protein